MMDRAQLQLRRRKVRDRSVVLLIVGAVLLLPPVGSISLIDLKLAGVPVPVFYVFAVWILLIAAAAFFARNQDPAQEDTDPLPGSAKAPDP